MRGRQRGILAMLPKLGYGAANVLVVHRRVQQLINRAINKYSVPLKSAGAIFY